MFYLEKPVYLLLHFWYSLFSWYDFAFGGWKYKMHYVFQLNGKNIQEWSKAYVYFCQEEKNVAIIVVIW